MEEQEEKQGKKIEVVETKKPKDGFEIVNGKEVMRINVNSFAVWKSRTAEGNYYNIRTRKTEREIAKRKIDRLKEEIIKLKQQIKKPLPKTEKPTKANYVAWFEKCKRDAEESEDTIWVGGDKPQFKGERRIK